MTFLRSRLGPHARSVALAAGLLAVAVVAVVVAVAVRGSGAGSALFDADETESGLPRSQQGAPPGPVSAAVEALEQRVRQTELLVARMEVSAARFDRWMTCISGVPVTEYGDPDQRFGYRYDEKDGTGPEFRRVLAVDPDPRRPDYLFLDFSQREDCRSVPTRPGTPENPGTADNAAYEGAAQPAPSPADTVRALQRTLADLTARAAALEAMSERFDEWESCLSWVPVTEYGDPDGAYGYVFTNAEAEQGFRPALAIDISEWDDPDFMVLAFAGLDRPFTARECDDEPGESVD